MIYHRPHPGGPHGREVLRGARRRHRAAAPARAHRHRGRQHLVLVPHHESTTAARGLSRGVEGRVRQAARQQPLHARSGRRPVGRRDDARHHRRQPGLREDRVPEAGLPRRHDLRGDGDRRQARVQVAPAVGHRDVRAPRQEPAWRRRDARATAGHDAQEGGLMPRRSIHFVPGGQQKMLEKALTLPADGLILDLEDAVPPERKAETRPIVRGWLERDFGGRERWIRMNPIATPLARADLEETIAGHPDGYVVPKPRHAGDVREIAQLLDVLEHRHGIPAGRTRLLPIATETPEGLLNIRDVAAASPRIVGISWGIEDLGAAMGLPRVRDERGQYLDIPRYARTMCAVAASAAGVEALDTGYTDIADLAGLR